MQVLLQLSTTSTLPERVVVTSSWPPKLWRGNAIAGPVTYGDKRALHHTIKPTTHYSLVGLYRGL